MKSDRLAFSLVELSIVLVILGLLTGGILSGQSLIRAAEMRAVGTEFTRYKTATASFRDKYFALPGDMTNATSFWTAAANCPGTSLQGSTTTATCDGNGDGILKATASSNEYYRYWQHLANAGLIEGSYSGVTGGAANDQVSLIGTNVPRSRMSIAGWSIYNMGAVPISTDIWFDGNYGNVLVFGAPQTGNSITDQPALKPEEAWNIDTKFDDGKPGLGSVRIYKAYGGGSCHDSPVSNSISYASTANYMLSNSAVSCNLVFILQ